MESKSLHQAEAEHLCLVQFKVTELRLWAQHQSLVTKEPGSDREPECPVFSTGLSGAHIQIQVLCMNHPKVLIWGIFWAHIGLNRTQEGK